MKYDRQPTKEEIENLETVEWNGQDSMKRHYKRPGQERTLCGMAFRRAYRGVIISSEPGVECKDCIRIKDIYLNKYIPRGD